MDATVKLNMRACLSFLLLLLTPAFLQAEIVWLQKSYDFGLMKEEAGPAKGSVSFENRGTDPVVITGARPSCGCTSVEYSEEPIAPGERATISFTYDPAGRPGKFDKSIRVYIGENDSYKIGITGNVLGTSESLKQFYPYECGPLRLSDLRINGGEMTAGTSRNFFIRSYNQTLDSISPAWVCRDPALTVSCSEKKIGPGDIAVFALFFDAGKTKEMGEIEIPLTIISDNSVKDSPSQEVIFSAKVTPDFSHLSARQVEEGPRCYLIPEKLDLGILSGESAKSLSFLIQNQGKGKLTIYRISPKSEALSLKRKPSVIKPSKSEEARLTVLLKEIPEGPFNIPVEVITDDPLHPVRILSVVGIK
ncbi:MAG: DUF1573 domain-containing protein, partial [Muribaculaceae bacterium]|nr:DUF1573 domain-containing protein [Muribaculaceae bacterium]